MLESKPELSTLPLSGVRVIEICHVAAGPFCGMLLSDFGADVIKIEPPRGDGLRTWPPINNGFSENFASLNRGKKSIALDLKNPEDRDVARRLILEADVVVENNRPGVMDRLGVGWSWAGEQNPALVYCSISAYGQSGPRSGEGGFDLTIQAAAGVMSVTGEQDGGPVKCGVSISDFSAGLYAAFSIASVLARVRGGGAGGHIDVPMFSSTLAIGALQTSEFFGSGQNPKKLGSAHPRSAPYQVFRAADGWFAMAAGNDRLWDKVCKAVDRQDLLEDPRFSTNQLRATNQEVLCDILEERFVTESAQSWLERLKVAGIPSGPLNSYEEALADPQSEHLQLVQPMTLPGGTETHTVVCPIWLDGAPVAVNTRSPELDEHRSVLEAELPDSC